MQRVRFLWDAFAIRTGISARLLVELSVLFPFVDAVLPGLCDPCELPVRFLSEADGIPASFLRASWPESGQISGQIGPESCQIPSSSPLKRRIML